jgi:hypothetical protein
MVENNTCTCGCTEPRTADTAPAGTCNCGCGGATASRAEEIAELRRMLESVQERLAALGSR